MEKKLIKYFKNFQLTDFLGFANILGVEETEDFEDFVTNIIAAALMENRHKRRELVKLAKKISEFNGGNND